MNARRDIQTWLADRIPWIPHPYLRRIDRPRWRFDSLNMSFSTAFTIGTISLFGVIVLSVVLIAMAYVAWLFFGCAIFNFCA